MRVVSTAVLINKHKLRGSEIKSNPQLYQDTTHPLPVSFLIYVRIDASFSVNHSTLFLFLGNFSSTSKLSNHYANEVPSILLFAITPLFHFHFFAYY